MEKRIKFPSDFRSVVFAAPKGFQRYPDGGTLLEFGGKLSGEIRPDAYYMGPRYTFYAGVISPDTASKFAPGERVPLSAAEFSAPVEYEISDMDEDDRAWIFRRIDPSATFAPEYWSFTAVPGLIEKSLFMTDMDTPAASIVGVREEAGAIKFAGGSLLEPALEPTGKSFPFAEGSSNPAWPVRSRHKYGRTVSYTSEQGVTFGSPARQFMASRGEGERYHAGIDVYANIGDTVLAMESGVIVNRYHFFHGTWCLIQQCDSGLVILYGEVEKNSWKKFRIQRGTRVEKGTKLALVGQMSGGSHMLHIETYKAGTTKNEQVIEPGKGPALDPTRYLLLAKMNEDRKYTTV